ncbi:MAG: FKBP-type peptidyl-prolyl cis-trans isomerase [bacterium]
MRITTVILGLLILATLAVGCNKTDEHEAQAEPQTQVEAQQPAATETEGSMEVITTESGLQYIDMVVGEGAEAVAGQTVEMHYTGWLKTPEGEKGTKFDSSHDRGQPFSFKLGVGQVIPGWDEGVAGMKVGGQRQLIIPSKLAYGERGAGGVIPPNADLIFDVEFLGVAGQ